MAKSGIVTFIKESSTRFKVAAAVVFVLLLLTSIPLGMAFAGQSKVKDNLTYVSIGDSYTVGYGLAIPEETEYTTDNEKLRLLGDANGYGTRMPNSYPDLFAKELAKKYNVTYKQLAQGAMRTYELRYILEEGYPKDGYYIDWYEDAWDSILPEMRAEYYETLKSADVITYDLGKNDLSNFLVFRLMGGYYDADLSNILDWVDAKVYYGVREQIHRLIDEYIGGEISSKDLETVEDLVDSILYAYLGFQINYDATLDIIREINPDAEIIVLTVGNAMYGVNVEIGGYKIPFGTILGSLGDMANLWMVSESKHVDDVLFVDATDMVGGSTLLCDEALNYQGDKYGISDDFKSLCNEYNSIGVFSSSRMNLEKLTYESLKETYGEAFDKKAFDDALNYGYDAVIRVMQASLLPDAMSLENVDIIFSQMEAIATSYFTAAYVSVQQAYVDLASGKDPNQETIDAYINASIAYCTSDTYSAASYLYFKMMFGSTGAVHPDVSSHKQMADAIAYVYTHPAAQETYQDVLNKIVDKYILAYKEYGRPFVSALLDAIADDCQKNREELSLLFAGLAAADTPEQFIEALANYLGYDGKAAIARIEQYVDEAQAYVEAHPELFHVHSMKLVAKQAPTCTQEGHKAYWQCKTCGKMYTDMLGAHEIQDLSEIAIPAAGHHYKFVKGLRIFRLVIIPDRYVCTECGAVTQWI